LQAKTGSQALGQEIKMQERSLFEQKKRDRKSAPLFPFLEAVHSRLWMSARNRMRYRVGHRMRTEWVAAFNWVRALERVSTIFCHHWMCSHNNLLN